MKLQNVHWSNNVPWFHLYVQQMRCKINYYDAFQNLAKVIDN